MNLRAWTGRLHDALEDQVRSASRPVLGARGRLLLLEAVLLAGALGACSAPLPLRTEPDDFFTERVWAALQCGDVEAARTQHSLISHADLRLRAEWDIASAEQGRAAVLWQLVAEPQSPDWLQARFDASEEVAVARLLAAEAASTESPAHWLELARRGPENSRRAAGATLELRPGPGALEALALEIERLLQVQEFQRAEEELAAALRAGPQSVRLRLLQRWLVRLTGRHEAAIRGVLDDLHEGRAVPASLRLLEESLLAQPSEEREAEVDFTLRSVPIVGPHMLRARDRLLAILAARAGRLLEARTLLASLSSPGALEESALRRWDGRLGLNPRAESLEERLEADPARFRGPDLLARRLAEEWNLAARQSYADHLKGDSRELSAFLTWLDQSAAGLVRDGLPEIPLLSSLPRRSYGIYGELLEVASLQQDFPEALILGGQALAHPAELVWYDRLECRQVDLPDGLGFYEECLVRRQRVLGFAASLGAGITGAGIDRTVYLDVEGLRDAPAGAAGGQPPRLPRGAALPADTLAARRALNEPLDVAERLLDLAREQGGGELLPLLRDALSKHERQHIVDFQRFVRQSAFSQVGSLLSAGLLPSSVRAEIERRAQVQALREARDPRVVLAESIHYLPPAAGDDEPHARAYAALLADFLRLLDTAAWPGARPLAELGLRRDRVLLQQLDLLEPETIRAIAKALPD
ncbi:MAG: hypothetical protein ACT4PU_02715 [Planctomycetota bacterium]